MVSWVGSSTLGAGGVELTLLAWRRSEEGGDDGPGMVDWCCHRRRGWAGLVVLVLWSGVGC